MFTLLFVALGISFLWGAFSQDGPVMSGHTLALAVGGALVSLAIYFFVFWYCLAMKRDFTRRHWQRGVWILIGAGIVQVLVYLPLTAVLFAVCWLLWTRSRIVEVFDES